MVSSSGEGEGPTPSGTSTNEDSATPPRRKRWKAILHISAVMRVKQFPGDLYESGGVLFCKYCQHSIDIYCVDTIKDHLVSKKHKAAILASSTSTHFTKGKQ